VQTRRLHETFEGSYSSLSSSSGELSRVTVAANGRLIHFLQFSDFGAKWGFWAITLVPDMLESQARALSTREIVQFPKTVCAKILVHGIGVQGPSNLVKKPKTPQLCEPTPGEPLTPIKKFFFNRTKKTFHIRRGFEHLSSCSGLRVIKKKLEPL